MVDILMGSSTVFAKDAISNRAGQKAAHTGTTQAQPVTSFWKAQQVCSWCGYEQKARV